MLMKARLSGLGQPMRGPEKVAFLLRSRGEEQRDNRMPVGAAIKRVNAVVAQVVRA